MTYFGRMYNFFVDSKFKSKTFLKDQKNEKEVLEYLKSLDDVVFDGFKQLKYNLILEANNLKTNEMYLLS